MIVAVTANAMAGDAEQCRAAGMDDYISKPISVRELRRVLAPWLDEAVGDVRPVHLLVHARSLSRRITRGRGGYGESPNSPLDFPRVRAQNYGDTHESFKTRHSQGEVESSWRDRPTSSHLRPDTPVPDLIERYRLRRDAWIAQADELARLQRRGAEFGRTGGDGDRHHGPP